MPADAALALREDALPLSQSLGTILHASTILGEKRQRLAADLALWRSGVRSGDRPWDERIGKLQVDIEVVAALIERAATGLDSAQVNSRRLACRTCAADAKAHMVRRNKAAAGSLIVGRFKLRPDRPHDHWNTTPTSTSYTRHTCSRQPTTRARFPDACARSC